jgi:chromosomal replication initiation ATPase DnaA
MKREIFNQYVEKTCKVFNIEPSQLFKKNKANTIADARHLLYYLCKHRNMQWIQIQEYMKDNGYTIAHSPIIYGVKKVTEKVESDRDWKTIVNRLK